MKESEIRDFLAQNLYVVSKELILIDTEYELKNETGTNGYVDILARDSFDNYVIIEVKRSKQSSRSAIHEIIKYVTLLKGGLRLKDSEIRVMIVSTEWDELYTPFCEWKEKTDWLIEGYKYNEDQTCEQISERKREDFVRELSRNQLAFLYKSKNELDLKKNNLRKAIQENGLHDFFLIELKNERNVKVTYPFALILVIQRYTECEYFSILNNKEWEKEEIFEYGYEGEALLVFLEECIYKDIIDSRDFNDIEICYPEKLAGMISQHGWELINVDKYGFFSRENRDNDWFLRKSIGLEEGNLFIFCDVCDTKYKLKFSEMIDNIRTFLFQKDDMLDLFNEMWKGLCFENLLRVAFQINNRGNIIHNLIMFEINGEVDELPCADVFLEYKDGCIEKIELKLAYTDNEIKPYSYILRNLLDGDGMAYMQMLWSGEITCYNAEIMKNLGLTYDQKIYKYDKGSWKIIKNPIKSKFSNFYLNHINDIVMLKQWYLLHVFN